MNPITREYAWAALVTFIAGFAGALAIPQGVELNQAVIFGIIASATREGIRAVMNLAFTYFSSSRTTISSR